MSGSATLDVARDFTPYLGGRYLSDGKGSGEALRNRIADLLQDHARVVVDLTGVRGCPSSCLEEAFGGLARHAAAYDLDPVGLADRIEVRSADIGSDAVEARDYLAEALERLPDVKRDDDAVG